MDTNHDLYQVHQSTKSKKGKFGDISLRGKRACITCRSQKMRCVAVEGSSVCRKCNSLNQECVFLESMRGKGCLKTKALAESVTKMEEALQTVLQVIGQSAEAPPHNDHRSPSALLTHSRTLTTLAPGSPNPPPQLFGFDHSKERTSAPGAISIPGTHQEGILELGKEDGFDDVSHSQLHSLPAGSLNALGLLAETSLLQNRRKRPFSLSEVLNQADGDSPREGSHKHNRLGFANESYFQSGPLNILPLRKVMIQQRRRPALLEEKVVTMEEVTEIFALFFANCHDSFPVLDPLLHTAEALSTRSPFLLTCICAVASRFYTQGSPGLYLRCWEMAKKTAFDIFAKGFKSPEICQGFLLLCHWNQSAERFEHERVYQFSGIAVRMATELNLNQKSKALLPIGASDEVKESYQRELLNRERCWLGVFVTDRMVAAQLGKLYCIPCEDSIIALSSVWYRSTSQVSDYQLCAMVNLHRINTRILDTMLSSTHLDERGLAPNTQYASVSRSFLLQLDEWRDDWCRKANDERDLVLRFHHAHYRLNLLAFALKRSTKAGTDLETPWLTATSFKAASDVIAGAQIILGRQRSVSYECEDFFVKLSFACCFLLKYGKRFTESTDVFKIVAQVVKSLQGAAVDDIHIPALHAVFLSSLVRNHLDPTTADGYQCPCDLQKGAIGAPLRAPLCQIMMLRENWGCDASEAIETTDSFLEEICNF